nr:hypothetical protein [Devosia enhydra]
MAPKNSARLDRQFERISRRFPLTARFIAWVRKPSSRILRIPLGIVLVLGGIFSFLPVLGIWMLPLGLLMLAIDLPFLQHPLNSAILRGERRFKRWRADRRDRKAAAAKR